jgi:phenylalanyl-tRNA synthetase beta chain
MRRSLIPSLLEARQFNEGRGNAVVELFETAKIYLPRGSELPYEQPTLGATSGGDYYALKGVLEALVQNLNPEARVSVEPVQLPLLEFGKTVAVSAEGTKLGVLGVVSAEGRKRFGLRGPASLFEIDISALERLARLIPQHRKQSPFPAVTRDVNLIVDEAVRWAELEATILASAGDQLESVQYRDTYRDAAKDGPGKKRLLFSMSLRSPERTLTGEEVDQVRDRVVQACGQQHGAVLLS